MKTIYLLTLDDENGSRIGQIGLMDNNKQSVIIGINHIMANGGEYYESYHRDENLDGSADNIQGGNYMDTVRWSITYLSVDELKVL